MKSYAHKWDNYKPPVLQHNDDSDRSVTNDVVLFKLTAFIANIWEGNSS